MYIIKTLIMNDSIKQKRIGKYLIEIFQDENPCNPREDDNVGTMVCFHNRYNLGDKHDLDKDDFNRWEDVENYLIKNEGAAVVLPLYLYDHSGITMSTTPFSCRWDSGQIGFIYVSKAKIMSEWGGKNKNLTPKLKEQATKFLKCEVETYDQYLTGDIYGFVINEISTCDKGCEHEEHVDSCWGYYGQEDCMKEAEGIVEHFINEETKVTV